MTSRSLDLSASVNEYFEEVVEQAIRAKRVSATQAAFHYLVELLSEFACPDRGVCATFSRPLTFLLRDALSAQGAERFGRLRRIGDGVLYMMGFFDSSVTRRGADREYVMSVGASAYSHASRMLRVGGDAPGGPDVLDELSSKYATFVEVLGEVADGSLASSAVHTDTAALRLYERWRRTGSETLAAELADLGLCPVASAEAVN